MLPLDVHPDAKFHPPIERLEVGEPKLAFGRTGERRPDQCRIARRFGRNEVDGKKLESNPPPFLVQGARTPLIQIGIVDPPRLEHASRKSGPCFDDSTGPIGEHRWHALPSNGLTGSVERLVVSIRAELESIRARRCAA
jgi:hypothetical protein